MQGIRHWIATPLTVATLVGLLAGCGSSSNSTGSCVGGSGPIVVGVVAPVTGAAHAIVGDFVAGAQVAVDEVNKAGGVCGRQLKLDIQDDQSVSSNDAALAEKLVDQDGAAGVVTVSDADWQVMGSYLASKNVLDVGAFTSAAANTAKDTFSVAIPTPIESPLWSAYMFGYYHVKRPATLYETTTTYGPSTDKVFCAAAQANGTPCVAHEQTTISTTDVTNQVADMKAHGADSIMMEGFGIPLVRTIQTARADGITGPILGDGTTATSANLIQLLDSSQAKQNYAYINYLTATQGNPYVPTHFINELKQQEGSIQDPLFVAMFGHDAVRLLAVGWEGAHSLSAAKASTYLETLNYKVGDGTFLLHPAVYSPQNHEPMVHGWETFSVPQVDGNGLAAVAPNASQILALVPGANPGGTSTAAP